MDYTLDWYRNTWKPMNFGAAVLPSTLLGTLPVGLVLFAQGSLQPADLVICIILSLGMITPLTTFANYTNEIKSIQYAVMEAEAILELKELSDASQPAKVKDYSIELKDVAFSYNDQGKMVLEGLNLLIPEKSFTALVGPSGGGKTTLLRMLAGLETIDSGQIIYENEEIPLDQMESRNLLGFVFQDFQLFPHLTVLDNLTLSPIKTMGMSKEDAQKKAQALLDRLGLGAHGNAYPYSLSGGQKQRVAFARAMMIDPKIVGYDEPTSALDPELRQEVEKLILQNRETGITQIVITHDMQFAQHIADEIVTINPK